MNKLCVLVAMFLIGCGQPIDSRVVRLERDVISTESAIAGIERDLYEVKGDVAELKESISLVGVKIDVLSRLISESPVSHKEPRDPSWEDCGEGVLPDQTEVPAPYPMPAKPADDATADLQRRVSELEQAKGIFGNVVLMANDAKIAADEEHGRLWKMVNELVDDNKMLRKSITELEKNSDGGRKDVAHAEKPVHDLRSLVFARSDFAVVPKEIPFDISDFEPWGVAVTTEITKESFGGDMPKAFDVRCYLPADLAGKLDLHVRFSWMYDVSSGRDVVRNAVRLSFSADETGYYAGYRHPNPIADSVYEMNITIVLRDGARMPVGYRDGLKREHVQVRVAPLKSTITRVP